MLAAIATGEHFETARAALDPLAPRDRALAYAMVQAALRHHGEIAAALAPYLKKPPNAPLAHALLHIGVAQLRHMDVAAHAAVFETVAAATGNAKPFAKLINAVLRRVSEAEALPANPTANLPEKLAAGWRKTFGEAAVAGIAQAMADTPPLDLHFKSAETAAQWCAGNETFAPTRPAPDVVRIATPPRIETLDGFTDGTWWVQDIAAGLAARLLPVETATLDLCAAPGGKTMQLAATGAAVTAVDFAEARVARLRENLKRTRLSADIIIADLTDWKPERQWPCVLLDAPCSATGTLRRHPELLRRKIAPDIPRIRRLLDRAAALTEAGGTLVFSVCSLEAEESETMAENFLAAHDDFSLAPIAAKESPDALADAVGKSGIVRTTPALLPEAGGCDGFFIARFKKSP